jgi:hypothetical protein
LTEQADVNRASANFVKVNIIRAAVGGGQILEQENVKEPPEQRVAANEITDCPAFLRQFLLHAADEDAVAHGCNECRLFPETIADDAVFQPR